MKNTQELMRSAKQLKIEKRLKDYEKHEYANGNNKVGEKERIKAVRKIVEEVVGNAD